MTARHIILGAGEIGNTIAQVVRGRYTVYDKGEWDHIDSFHDNCILHICIPYSVAFVKICKQAIKTFGPRDIIIHSTVQPGTTRKVDSEALYSPVNGRHQDGLLQTVRSYPKLFSGDNISYERVCDEFDLKCHYVPGKPENLEYAKVMCTSYMMWGLIFERELTRDCANRGLDREVVYTMWNRMYNNGISEHHPEWQRPIYTHSEGPIGGHCLVPNLELVKNEITGIGAKYARIYRNRGHRQQNRIIAKES